MLEIYVILIFFQSSRQGKIRNIDDVDDLANNVYLSFAEQYQNIENLEFWLRRVLFLNFVSWYKKNNSIKLSNLKKLYYIENNEFKS